MTFPNKDFWYTLRCFVVKITLGILALAAAIGIVLGLSYLISTGSKTIQHIITVLFIVGYTIFMGSAFYSIGRCVWESCSDAVAWQKPEGDI